MAVKLGDFNFPTFSFAVAFAIQFDAKNARAEAA
jgi:hypothetical protein